MIRIIISDGQRVCCDIPQIGVCNGFQSYNNGFILLPDSIVFDIET